MAKKLTSNASVDATADKPKRGRKPAAATAPSTNITDTTVQEFCTKALDARKHFDLKKGELRTAKGKFDAVLSEAKKAGVPIDAIKWWLDNKDRDPAEIDRETAERNRIAKLMNMPIGSQLGFLAGQLTVATAIENDNPPAPVKTEEEAKSEAYFAGFNALDADSRTTIQDNPYEDGTTEAAEWKRGWIAKQSKLTDDMSEKATKRMPKAKGTNGKHAVN